jgi:hypothetical protein
LGLEADELNFGEAELELSERTLVKLFSKQLENQV